MEIQLATPAISAAIIQSARQQLDSHPVYGAVSSPARLARFMEHHVYSVWDFMSLIKFLQARVAPTTMPWVPRGDGDVRRFINELVLEEESDEAIAAPDDAPGDAPGHSSHFELYCAAMREVGADPSGVLQFIELASSEGVEAALKAGIAPDPSRTFTETTFDFIGRDKPHEVAAALALGREHIIPAMFRSFLADMEISEMDAPIFHFYLKRHIHLDEDFHAPMSLKLLNALCGDDPEKAAEAEAAAHHAVAARLVFWDGVHAALVAID